MRKAKQKAIEGFKALGVTSRKSTQKIENAEKSLSKIRSPLKIQSKNIPEEKIKACHVVLDRMTKINTETSAKTTTKTASPEQIQDKKNKEKIYDYSFDADILDDLDKNSDQMQDFFKKLADEKKITLKKYRPKIGKQKTDKTVGARKKPRNEVQQVKSQQEKPNLNKVDDKQLRSGVKQLRVDSNKNILGKIDDPSEFSLKDKEKEKNNIFDEKNKEFAGNKNEKIGTENKFALHHRPTHQSTPISMPLRRTRSSIRTSVSANVPSPSPSVDTSSIDFDNNYGDIDLALDSPTSDAVLLQKSPRKSARLSANIPEKEENSSFVVEKTPKKVPGSTSGTQKDSTAEIAIRKSPRNSVQSSLNKQSSITTSERTPRKVSSPISGASKVLPKSIFSGENTQRKSPRKAVSTTQNKENPTSVVEKASRRVPSPIPGTSKDFFKSILSDEHTPRKSPRKSVHFADITSTNKENSVLVLESIPSRAPSPVPGTSKDFFDSSVFSMERTPKKSLTTSINHCSILSSSSRADNIFPVKTYSTPKKQSERTPLKNIENENSTFSVSYIDLHDSSTRSSTMTSNKTIKSSIDLVLQEDVEESPNLFDCEHPSDRIQSKYTIQNCFGFNDDDEDDVVFENNETSSSNKKSKKQTIAANSDELLELRQRLKQFLHNPVSPSKKEGKRKFKRAPASKPATPAKSTAVRAKSPIPSTSYAVSQSTPKIFSESKDNQKDIRSVFCAVDSHKDIGKNKRNANREPSPLLFEELETVQDRRKSYARPAKQYQKRRISIESDNGSDHEEDEPAAKARKTKRKKLVEAPEKDKEDDELEKFAKEFSLMCDEVDQYELVTAKE